MSVCGPIKDIFVIISSAVIFDSPVTPLQWFGFSLSLCGIMLYNWYKRQDPRTINAVFMNFNDFFLQKLGLVQVPKAEEDVEEQQRLVDIASELRDK